MPLEIVVGPMFAGKTSYALDWIYKQSGTGLVLKPRIDSRYRSNVIVSHSGEMYPCKYVDEVTSYELSVVEYIVIDEAQFVPNIRSIIEPVLNKKILLVGLDADSDRQPFGELLNCIPLASKITKLTGECYICKNPSTSTFRVIQSNERVLIGGSESYIPVCNSCFEESRRNACVS
jgi:thymidine kinase